MVADAVAQAVPLAPAERAPLPGQPYHLASDPSVRVFDPADPFAAEAELPLEQLVAEVQARNPSLQAMSAAWRAAVERSPQMISLEDPMFGFMVSPSGLGPMGGWMVETSQKLPWPGKRQLRGSMAQFEAAAARGEIGDTRLRLAEAARTAFFDYYLARRQLEVNASTTELLRQFRAIAKTKYEANQATEQDVLQADVELADLEGRRVEYQRDELVTVARINTLLHRAADCPLPPPPAQVNTPAALPAVESLQQTAIQLRPDLYSLRARVQAEQANLALQGKEYLPDFEVVGKYDALMPEDMRPQVGMNMNVPLCRQRRAAAVREAQARVVQRSAEYHERVDQVRFEVQSAYQRVVQGAEVIRLYTQRSLPAAEQNLRSAQANYTTGRVDFLRLIEAERQLNELREKHYQAVAEYHRRAAELDRAVGSPVVEIAGGR